MLHGRLPTCLSFDNDERHLIAFGPISEAARSWSCNNTCVRVDTAAAHWRITLSISTVAQSGHLSLLHGILFFESQCSAEAAFFQMLETLLFNGLRSDSMALSHAWLDLSGGRFQSDGGL